MSFNELEEELVKYLASGDLPQAAIPLEHLPQPRITVAPLPSADVHFHLGDLLSHIGREADAERHFQTALDLDSEHSEVHAGLALVRDLQGRTDEAEVLYRDAIELGSSEALTYLLYGRHLLSRLSGKRVEGREVLAERCRAALRRAVELDDDYAEAWALLGRAHFHGEVDPGPGVRAFERARELLPDRLDLVFHLARLEVLNRRPERADALVEGRRPGCRRCPASSRPSPDSPQGSSEAPGSTAAGASPPRPRRLAAGSTPG